MLTHFQVAGLTPAALSFSDAPQVFPRVFKNSFNLLEFPENQDRNKAPLKSLHVRACQSELMKLISSQIKQLRVSQDGR